MKEVFQGLSATSTVCKNDVLEAENRIRKSIRGTPVEYSYHLSAQGKSRVYLKLEHLQHTGSFKVRGAMNKILSLSQNEIARGVVTASNGNHGLAVSFAAKQVGVTPTIYMREGVAASRVALITALGGRAVFYGKNSVHAEIEARRVAEQNYQVFISPYNDPQVIAGQGTIGVELHRQLEHIDAVFVAVGGGGLISGIATYLKSVSPGVKIIGCWPENSRVMYESIKAGQVLDYPEEPTISDSTAGGIEPGTITLDLCRELIDDFVLVSESEIASAMGMILEKERWVVEGAAGVAVASYLKEREKFEGQTIIILLCGRNVSVEKVKAVL